MKKITVAIALLLVVASFTTKAANWPQTITASDGSIIKIYEPESESFSGNILKSRSAISIQQSASDEPKFGTFWAIQTVETDRDSRQVRIVSVKVPNLKMSSSDGADKINFIKTTLETEIPKLNILLPLDDIVASLDAAAEQKKISKDLSNAPPKIYYATEPSLLAVIDGKPQIEQNNDWGVGVVVNSPFTIVQNTDGRYYLYGGKHWYSAPDATGPFSYVSSVPANLNKVQSAIDNAAASDAGYTTTDQANAENTPVKNIIVSTQPAELLQTQGPAVFTSIDGTLLSYASNSNNDIFRDQNSNQYFVLLSGRWYKASDLYSGNWQYVSPSSLPADFAKIPEGSPKDNVLASVVGTAAAREAIMDAQIPQTAKVDRKTATTNVTYDGQPQFTDIEGTTLQYAPNTQSSVIRYRNNYYVVDKGVWFISSSPTGPWAVCTVRPDEVDLIPPSSPVYNIKYVYIYDVTPDWAYMGYTPGYLNAYVYGPTVVYGTGFYYKPWRGRFYYPRAYTWGFGIRYNPWIGWSFDFNFNYGWLNCGWGMYPQPWNIWYGGWWGPAVYRPPYRPVVWKNIGYYGRNAFQNNRVVINNSIRITNNVYNSRRDVITRNNDFSVRNSRQGTGSRNRNDMRYNNGDRNTGTDNRNWGNNQGGRRENSSGNTGQTRRQGGRSLQENSSGNRNLYTDAQGNVYQRNSNAQWQQRQQKQWQPVTNRTATQNLDQQEQKRERGESRVRNFEMTRGNTGNRREESRNGNGSSGEERGNSRRR